jgi:hypothetical protein
LESKDGVSFNSYEGMHPLSGPRRATSSSDDSYTTRQSKNGSSVRRNFTNCHCPLMKTAVLIALLTAYTHPHLFYAVMVMIAALTVMVMTNPDWQQKSVFNSYGLLKSQNKDSQCNMYFNNEEYLHTWYWRNVTSEECDNPCDDFYVSLSAHKQAQFKHYMDNPDLQHMNFRDSGLSKQERTQAFSTPSTPGTSSSQNTKQHSNCTAPTPAYHSSEDTEPKTNTCSRKYILYQVGEFGYGHLVDVPPPMEKSS